jgi:hypothetical protein
MTFEVTQSVEEELRQMMAMLDLTLEYYPERRGLIELAGSFTSSEPRGQR